MRWAGRVARMEERRGSYGVFLGKPGWNQTTWKTLVGGKIILKFIINK